ncbi:MAG: hypothetical protein M3N10_09450 [Actinomycetota bacterium]|nr:hypothetical protein [Actinomycetota bacterium]
MDRAWSGDGVLLGRMEGNVPGYLSYSVEYGEVLCVFRSMTEAEEFYARWRLQIPGEGWGAVRLSPEELVGVLTNFDLVSISPQPVPGATEYLLPVEDFAQMLRDSQRLGR